MKNIKKIQLIILSIAVLCTTACNSNKNELINEQSSLKYDVNEMKDMENEDYKPEKIKVLEDGSVAVVDGSIDEPWTTKGLWLPEEAKETEISSYKICEGTDIENEIIVLKSNNPGHTVFIVAGIHGDEVAGYEAINKIKNMELKNGEVYILSPANKLGSIREPKTRNLFEGQNLNRAFPGTDRKNEAEILANEIFEQIKLIKPSIVVDHHEARVIKGDRDFLGSSFIYSSLDGIEDLIMDLIMETESGNLCSEKFNYFSPGPAGSINREVTNELKIPVITVETFRGYPLERRVEDHLAVIGYILKYYDMI